MITFPNAKINLGLHITEKRLDGYHNLETVFYPVPLEDALEIHLQHTPSTNKYALHLSGIKVIGNADDNLVIKAYQLLDQDFELPPIDIHLFKHIPSGAGLGGGSADAAFMLKLLNERFGLNLTTEQLETYAATLGADCAFFIRNEPTFAEGIGNVFSPISLSLKGYQLVIIKPDIFVSTREAFSQIRPQRPEHSLCDSLARPIEEWKECVVNDFEASVFPQHPAIKVIKEELYRQGAVYASMSGSGSSVFGLFQPESIIPEMDFKNAFIFQGVLK